MAAVTTSTDPDGGKVAVVTGASTGIGRASAAAFAREGMKVVLAARRADRLADAVNPLLAAGYDVIGVPTDVSDWASTQQLAEQALDAYGRVDIAFLNAGVAGSSPLRDIDLAGWDTLIGTNVYGLLHGIKAFLPILERRPEGGSLLATSSAAGVHGTSYNGAAYAATKSAQLSIMECLYGQLRDAGSPVHVGVVLPPLVRTHLAGDDPAVFDEISRRLSASGKSIALIEPEEFAEVVLEGVRKRAFWIEADEEQNERLFGGRNGDTIRRAAVLINRKAEAMVAHLPPDRYLW
jgi:NAD(P)-dependent dehydrogenase (short-subunit alcohol dehydrogenase family)